MWGKRMEEGEWVGKGEDKDWNEEIGMPEESCSRWSVMIPLLRMAISAG